MDAGLLGRHLRPRATPAAIAASLTEAQRHLWILTVLTVASTEAQRRAFIQGYNGQPYPPANSSREMRDKHRLGLAVRAHLEKNDG